MTTKSAKTVPLTPPAVRFRAAIEALERDGVARADMMLRLTLHDAAHLRRDRSLAIEDISYASGTMLFLGVPTVSGGIENSRLDKSAT
jgi:hypothetical protein